MGIIEKMIPKKLPSETINKLYKTSNSVILKEVKTDTSFPKYTLKYDELINNNIKLLNLISTFDTSFYFFRESCLSPGFPVSADRFKFRIHEDLQCDYCHFTLSYPEGKQLLDIKFLNTSKTPVITKKVDKLKDIGLVVGNVYYNVYIHNNIETSINTNKHFSIDLGMFKLIFDQKYNGLTVNPSINLNIKYPSLLPQTEGSPVLQCITTPTYINVLPNETIKIIEKGALTSLVPVEETPVTLIDHSVVITGFDDCTEEKVTKYNFSDGGFIYFTDSDESCKRYKIRRIKNNENSTITFDKTFKDVFYTATNKPENGHYATGITYITEGKYKDNYKITYSDNVNIYYYTNKDKPYISILTMEFPNGNTISITKIKNDITDVVYNPPITNTNA